MLKNKTVVVTGAARGIGFAIAKEFAAEGANIVLNYRSQLEEEAIKEIEAYGVQCFSVKADVSDFNQAEALVKAAKEQFGTIDVVVNSAGITKDNLIIRMSEDDFDKVIATNLKGVFNMTKHVANVMIKQRFGTIINISSVSGVIGNAGQANYAASKAGVIGLTKTTARELAIRGITCNAIAPGFIVTDMTETLKDEIKEKMKSAIPLNRFGESAEIGEAAVFLAKSKYITGQVLNVDGGMVM